ncbi:HTTM domain-containing protein [Lacinutrix salivirga]
MSTTLNVLKSLFTKVDSASIAVFRILFGAIMLVEVYRYFDKGWIAKYWIDPTYNFPYWPFHFLESLSGNGMYYLFALLGLLSVFIMLGLFYRLSIILFFLSFTYMFLLEQTRYLNHFYLIVILSFVLIFIPANNSFSLDNRWIKKQKDIPISKWCLWLLRLMIGIPFFYGGIAKLNSDWLAGQPLGIWLSSDTDFPIIGRFFTEKWMILLMSYSGLFLDLLIIPFLLFKRTRIYAFVIGVLFHLMNSELFTIGIFPWFMIASATLFFSPSWPRTLINRFTNSSTINPITENTASLSKKQKLVIVGLSLWTFLMLTFPLRHILIPGNVSWTEEGHKFAWHMKLRTKRANGVFIVKDTNGEVINIIDVDIVLPKWQRKKAISRPPIIWLLANKTKEEYKAKGINVAVFADIEATLNGRPYEQFIDPNVDIAAEPYPIWHADWILPLTTPLPE